MPKREKPASKLQFKVVVDEQQSGSDNMDQKVVTLMQGFLVLFLQTLVNLFSETLSLEKKP